MRPMGVITYEPNRILMCLFGEYGG